MSNGSWILEDLVVVTALVCLVTEEVDSRIVDATWQILLILNVLEAVCLIPTLRKYIEGDLTTNGVAVIVSSVSSMS